MFTAAYLTTSLVVLAVGARYLIAGRFPQEAKTMMRMGLGMVACLAPLQAVIGDMHGLNTAEHQPAKVAAIEAHWDGSKPAPLVLFALPNEREERNDFEISIPKIASFLITHDTDGLFKGLKDFKPEDRPPVAPPFFAFRLMVGLGVVMIGIGVVGAFLWVTRTPVRHALVSRSRAVCVAARLHRHPRRLVCHRDRAPAVDRDRHPAHGGRGLAGRRFGAVLFTLILFVAVYTAVFSMGIYYINRLIEKGPAGAAAKPEEGRAVASAFGRHRGRARSHRRGEVSMDATSHTGCRSCGSALLGTAVALYVMLDGFDLGIGILFPSNPEEEHRDVMMNSVAPFWDGNETWLILGGGGLFVAFPMAYGIIMSGALPARDHHAARPRLPRRRVRVPLGGEAAITALGPGLRRWLDHRRLHAGRHPRRALAGHHGRERRLRRRHVRLAHAIPAVLRTGDGCRLRAARRDVARHEDRGRRSRSGRASHAQLLLLVVLAALAIVSLWTPLAVPRIWERWFSLPNLFYLSPIPLLTALAAFMCWRGLETRHDTTPFVSAIALFLLGFVGLAISNLPYLVPTSVTIWQAAAHPSSQLFMLVGDTCAAARDSRLHGVRLLDLPRQDAPGRGVSLSERRPRSSAPQSVSPARRVEAAREAQPQLFALPPGYSAFDLPPVGAGIELQRAPQERRLDVVIPERDLGLERGHVADRARARRDHAVGPEIRPSCAGVSPPFHARRSTFRSCGTLTWRSCD